VVVPIGGSETTGWEITGLVPTIVGSDGAAACGSVAEVVPEGGATGVAPTGGVVGAGVVTVAARMGEMTDALSLRRLGFGATGSEVMVDGTGAAFLVDGMDAPFGLGEGSCSGRNSDVGCAKWHLQGCEA
jgi:hypothetical protein